ncbi:MAG: MBOAT family protein [Clostridiales bacterium]|nr:MBOAT family protein [Clostridiales bacterium]
MVFSSPLFLFAFFPLTVILYYIAPGKAKNYVLLAMSLLFYSWGEPRLVLLMVLSIIVNYILAACMEKSSSSSVRKLMLILSVVLDLGFLFYYKYLNFFNGILMQTTGHYLTTKYVALPIGISFYTFQIMSYVIDVYRKNVKAQKNPFYLALYISLFPQLIAGPIVRYIDVEKQIRERKHTSDKFYEGAVRFMKGFCKKVLIADQLAPLVNLVFDGKNESMLLAWAALIAYTLQIYYDFSGYSDMAIGMGKIFGFDFAENFTFPYISQSIKEFWRRWHISLSTWFRDYVYIPLGGSRKGTGRTYLNLFIVFLLTGFWHGASWNFLFWGIFYAVFLILERLGWGKVLEKMPRFFRHLYALFLVSMGWVLFRAADLTSALLYYRQMFTWNANEWDTLLFTVTPLYRAALLAGILFAFPHTPIWDRLKKYRFFELGKGIVFFLLFLVAICFMTGAGFSPFLYFRF